MKVINGSIKRVVHIYFSNEILDEYNNACKHLKERYLMWIYGDAPWPTIANYGEACDEWTVLLHLAIWKDLRRQIQGRGHPLPAAKHILPYAAAKHNFGKIGVDTFSAVMSHVKHQHKKLSATGTLYLRLLLMVHYNTWISWRMLQGYEYLLKEDATFFKWKKYMNSLGSFSIFCKKLAQCNLKAVYNYNVTGIVSLLPPSVPIFEEVSNTSSTCLKAAKSLAHLYDGKGYTLKRLGHSLAFPKSVHHLIPIDEHQKATISCVVCCCVHIIGKQYSKHTRRGNRPSFQCSCCNVRVCQTKRFTDDYKLIDANVEGNPFLELATKSCFTVFHEKESLSDLLGWLFD
jgi:hypothetical protein